MRKSRNIRRMLFAVLFVVFCFGMSLQTQAATPYQSVPREDLAGRTKIGKYYFWTVVSMGSDLYYSKSKSGKGTLLLKDVSGVVTNGSTLYYGREKCNFQTQTLKLYLYQFSLKTKKSTYLGSVKNGSALSGYYDNKLYVNICPFLGSFFRYLSVFDIRTKKVKVVNESYGGEGCYGQYMVMAAFTGGYGPYEVSVYNMKTNQNKTLKGIEQFAQMRFVSGKYFYYIGVNKRNNYEVCRYNLETGKNQRLNKKEIKSKTYLSVKNWTRNYIEYYLDSTYTKTKKIYY